MMLGGLKGVVDFPQFYQPLKSSQPSGTQICSCDYGIAFCGCAVSLVFLVLTFCSPLIAISTLFHFISFNTLHKRFGTKKKRIDRTHFNLLSFFFCERTLPSFSIFDYLVMSQCFLNTQFEENTILFM